MPVSPGQVSILVDYVPPPGVILGPELVPFLGPELVPFLGPLLGFLLFAGHFGTRTGSILGPELVPFLGPEWSQNWNRIRNFLGFAVAQGRRRQGGAGSKGREGKEGGKEGGREGGGEGRGVEEPARVRGGLSRANPLLTHQDEFS